MEKLSFTRTQLYDLVWSKTTPTLAKEYGITDHNLRTICKTHKIPLPYLGYWAKLKHGKPARKIQLPADSDDNDEIIFNPAEEKTLPIQKEISSETRLIMEIEANHKQLLIVPDELINPDELIKKAKRDLITDKSNRRLENGLVIAHVGIISIKVAPENVHKALRFMDSLIKLLKERGHQMMEGIKETTVIVFGEEISIRYQEKLRFEELKEKKSIWGNRVYFPTGVMTFRMWKTTYWQQKVWIDGKVPIEKQLAKIVAGIEIYAQKEKDKRLEREERWRIEAEKKRLEQERFDREELDGANFKKLLAQSQLWKQAMILKDYIDAIESNALKNGGLSVELKDWLKWAKEKAERFNPINVT